MEKDNFILQNNGSFLQSSEWGNFYQTSGLKVFQLTAKEGDDILAQAQVTKETFFSKSYLYVPFGPVFRNGLNRAQKDLATADLLGQLKDLARKEGCIFLRIEPVEALGQLRGFFITEPPKRVQPQKTWVLDLTKSEEELFKNLGRTTKYNVGLAKRHGVTVKKQSNYSHEFYKLLQQTKSRQEFGIFKESHYKRIFEITGHNIKPELFLAEYQGKVINATIVLYFSDSAITLHAGSDYEYRKIKGSNILEWEIILEAKKRGFKKLDFWGIDEKKWPTLTDFKKGFGGYELNYPKGVDIVFKRFWYFLYKTLKHVLS